ncbi:MAG: DUF2723 domain-containing protein [Chitinophagia bacterium]|nr:DUF2723 domain-containing protein [Chitinophagia bacterium]
MQYRKINNIFGWVTMAIALITYTMTMEPTVSFWDCGEFLSCAYKLEVGHSPGAPFFMLMQRLFAICTGGAALTGGSSENAAWAINFMSALNSALTILFLFWTITIYAKRLLVGRGNDVDAKQTALIMGAGVVGALAYTFSDTFWFSAVEAEVYATSSLFTALTFWLVLKWEEIADEKYADRYLVLISFLIGLSVCVHLLNLLTIPPLAMVYYFRRYKATRMGTFIAFLAGVAVLAFVQYGVIQYIPKIASVFDIMFTNGFHASFDTGSIVFLFLLFGLLGGGVFIAMQKKHYHLHTALLCVVFIIIGYSAYLSAIIRSRANVPIDMTNPDNPITFLDYVNREQFGQQPIFIGPYYNSVYTTVKDKGKIYAQYQQNGKDYYKVVGTKKEPKYDFDQLHFFPRIWDQEGNHVNFYKSFLNYGDNDAPNDVDNFKFFFVYQMDWMWWRFFMWNYAGRQNDMEGQLDKQRGNWISGITPLDQIRGLGDTDTMASGYADNDAHNKLYFLPLILGIMGLVIQFRDNKQDWFIVMLMFFFTGAAIGIFLNMPPLQPRERDYAFAGCTYTFAIWIGLGVLYLHQLLEKVSKKSLTPHIASGISLLAVPIFMANVEWKDHDRSKKTLARAVAHNTLMACAPNAVLFTFGDNQTYPLWYLQEIEGFRRDVRIINTSLLGIDWYVDQLNYRTNDAQPVPMIWKRDDYTGDKSNYIRFFASKKLDQNRYYNLKEVCQFMASNNDDDKLPLQSGDLINYMPTKNFYVPTLTKEQLLAKGLISVQDTANVFTEMKYSYPKETAFKSDLAILNIIAGVAEAGWERPLYFDAGLRSGDYGGAGDYLRLEGNVYRLLPYKYKDSLKNPEVLGTINTEKSYDLFMKYWWGGAERNDVYFDEPNRHEFVTYRMNAATLAKALYVEGKKEKGLQVLDKVMTGITEHSYPYDYSTYYIAAAYFRLGEMKKAKDLSNKIIHNAETDLKWVGQLSEQNQVNMGFDVRQQLNIMQSLSQNALMVGDSVYAKEVYDRMGRLQPLFKGNALKEIMGKQGGGGDDEE